MASREELSKLVLAYLAAAEARDLPHASAYLSASADIVFPGGVQHGDLGSVVTAAANRYRTVRKSIDTVDVDEQSSTVIVAGRLEGENLHGVRFVDVRFIDRFHITDGSIDLQHVWNDLEASGVLSARRSDDVPASHRS